MAYMPYNNKTLNYPSTRCHRWCYRQRVILLRTLNKKKLR